jgi:hypothetical protein
MDQTDTEKIQALFRKDFSAEDKSINETIRAAYDRAWSEKAITENTPRAQAHEITAKYIKENLEIAKQAKQAREKHTLARHVAASRLKNQNGGMKMRKTFEDLTAQNRADGCTKTHAIKKAIDEEPAAYADYLRRAQEGRTKPLFKIGEGEK